MRQAILGALMAVGRQVLEAREAAALAPYAMPSRASRGRRYPEDEHPFRMKQPSQDVNQTVTRRSMTR